MAQNETSELEALSNADIALLCTSKRYLEVLSPKNNCFTVVRLTDQLVVKFGEKASEQEYNAQLTARQLVDLDIVYVPAVYRYFRLDNVGYIVMEYVDGKSFSQVDESRKQEVITAVEHLGTIKCPDTSLSAGPLAGGCARGPVWQECGDFSPTSAEMIEQYWVSRLAEKDRPLLSLQHEDIVLCHLDLAERNVIFPHQRSVCFIDWESAGFYPQLLEYSALGLNWDREFEGSLTHYMIAHYKLILDKPTQETLNLLSRARLRDLSVYHGPKTFPNIPDEELLAFLNGRPIPPHRTPYHHYPPIHLEELKFEDPVFIPPSPPVIYGLARPRLEPH